MKVAIDVSPLKNDNRYRGVGIYTKQLVKSLQSLNISGFSCQLIENKAMAEDSDLIHFPFFDPFFLTLPLKKTKPTIVTIHDVIPLIFPKHFPLGLRGSLKFQAQRFSLKSVRGVITDSQNSKKDIIKYLNFPQEKIYVVPLAPSENFKVMENQSIFNEVRKKYHLPEKFVLYVGDVNYNKNIPGLIRAFARIEKNLKLILVGKAFEDESLKETKEIIQLINSLKLSKKVIRLGW
ncbi:glycosyltransferase, partial [Patescibacteria group bacterium]|nr:glycosyltransferase [Patescibacteria group bacterium]